MYHVPVMQTTPVKPEAGPASAAAAAAVAAAPAAAVVVGATGGAAQQSTPAAVASDRSESEAESDCHTELIEADPAESASECDTSDEECDCPRCQAEQEAREAEDFKDFDPDGSESDDFSEEADSDHDSSAAPAAKPAQKSAIDIAKTATSTGNAALQAPQGAPVEVEAARKAGGAKKAGTPAVIVTNSDVSEGWTVRLHETLLIPRTVS